MLSSGFAGNVPVSCRAPPEVVIITVMNAKYCAAPEFIVDIRDLLNEAYDRRMAT